MHWADVVASKVTGKQVVSTAISPSGEIHVGNMREVLTGEIVSRALKKTGITVKFYYEADDIDPLRKVPNGIDQSFSKFVGQPLYKIPSPDGKHTSWSNQFIDPFVETLNLVGAKPEFLYTHELYEKGLFNDLIEKAIDNREKISSILSEVSGKEIKGEYYPLNVICENCGRIDKTIVKSIEWPYAEYHCEACGYVGRRDVRNGGAKLPWRVEWPAKWVILGVTIEPFGKDHATAGGSYDTGKRIAREVFGIEPPTPVVYEWIHLKGMGAMHSSKGILIRAIDMVKMVPPEVLRFLIAKNNPERHIEIDAGRGLISLVNEYDQYERIYFKKEPPFDPEKEEDYRRIYELSQISDVQEKIPVQVPYNHIINLVQIKKDINEIMEALRWSGYDLSGNLESLKKRIEAAKFWLENFAPDEFKITIKENPPNIKLDENEKNFLREVLNGYSKGLNPDDINKMIHDACSKTVGEQKKCFSTLYRIILGTDTGPRIGFLMTSLDHDFVARRIKFFIEN